MGNDDAKLFVRGLSDGMTESVVRALFESTGGKVLGVSVPRDRDTGRTRGIAFVTMGSGEQADAARAALDGSMQQGRNLLVRPYEKDPPKREVGMGPSGDRFGVAYPREGKGVPPSTLRGGFQSPSTYSSSSDRQLYVGNLPYDCSVEEIEALVNGVSGNQVQRVHLPTEPDGRKRGFGFVTMASGEAVAVALAALQELDLRGRKLNVKVAQPRAERPARTDAGNSPDARTYGGGGYGGAFVPPPQAPQRKTFDERRKGNKHNGGGGSWDDGPKKRRFNSGHREPDVDSWDDDE